MLQGLEVKEVLMEARLDGSKFTKLPNSPQLWAFRYETVVMEVKACMGGRMSVTVGMHSYLAICQVVSGIKLIYKQVAKS